MAIRESFYSRIFIALVIIQACVGLPVAARGQASSARTEGATQATAYFSDPAISPDRSEVAFVSGGDIWTAPAEGGEARIFVSHPATESRPLYSPDGRRLAFVSTRTGNGDIYVLDIESGNLQRLTFDDRLDQLDAWSYDGRWLYFSSTARDIGARNDIYRVSAEGGTPTQVSADRYSNEFTSAPAPNGTDLAFTARGFGQWWRKGSSHIDQSEIWLMRDHSTARYEQVTEGGAREMWPMWGEGGRSLYYVSDRGGAANIWMRPLGAGQARQLTKFGDGRVVWPNISYDGRTIVFERDFAVWKLDTRSGEARPLRIMRRGAVATPVVERLRQTDQFQELALAPDGKKVAFVVRGEVFAASSTDGGDAVRVTSTHAIESQVMWAPDSRRLVYVSNRNGEEQLFLFDFAANAETQLTTGSSSDAAPRFSPDGKMVAYIRDGRELRILNLDSRQERTLATGNLERPPLNADRPFVWSPDSRWIAFMPVGARLFRNISVVPADGSAPPRPVSFLANVFSNTVSWSPDGTFILFDTGQRTEVNELARVDLLPRLPRFREDQFRELFREDSPRTTQPSAPRRDAPAPTTTQTPAPETTPATPATPAQTPAPSVTPAPSSPAPTQSPTPAPSQTPAQTPALFPTPGADEQRKGKNVEIVFDNIRRRMSFLPVAVDVSYQTISADGKYVLMIAGAANQTNLYVFPLDELTREPLVARQITSTPGFKTSAQFSPDSREVFYLEQGRIQVATVDQSRPVRTLNVAAEMDVDFAREKMEIFQQGWSYLRDNFYDPQFHGLNWQEVRARYQPLIEGARTPDEMRRLMQLMVGELNASHLDVSPPPTATQTTTGRLGLDFDRAEYESTGRLRVTSVLPLGPGALARAGGATERQGEIKPGDYLLAVDGREITGRVNLDELLNYKVSRRVTLTVASTRDGANRREVDVRPVSITTEKALRYRKWVEEKRAYVARVSGGRLGFVHMFDMTQQSLSQLYQDLDAENYAREGVVLDIRNNNGGFVNAYALDVFGRRNYLSMTPRGETTAPARTVLGQRALGLPTILVTDQYTLSDGEDFTEGYRALRLGKVIGEPTAGWIIFTSNVPLIDGSIIRLPSTRIDTSEGVNMERNPRRPDVEVERPFGESYTERDTQLDVAVRELLKQLDQQGTRGTEARRDR